MGREAGFVGGGLVADADGNVVGDVTEAEYLAHYAANFATNRRGYFHYVLMAHRYTIPGINNSSGNASFGADRMMVTLYCRASETNVGHTIAHELGHNLDLHHGGDTDCNGKPNYNSIMNHRYQFRGIDTTCQAIGNAVANYSMGVRAALNENSLFEPSGVCGAVPLDWNENGFIDLAHRSRKTSTTGTRFRSSRRISPHAAAGC